MSPDQRPWRYRGIRDAGEARRPSVTGNVLLTVVAVLLTCLAVYWVFTPNPENIPGDVIRDAIVVAIAWWFDRHVMRRWERLHAPAPD